MTRHVAGFDIGGTKTLGVVVDDDGTVLAEQRVPRPRGPEATLSQIAALTAELSKAAERTVDAIGVGIAGAISRDGSVQYSPNIAELTDFPLRELLRERVGLPVMIDNDATAATWAEHQLGAGRGIDDLLYVALGTGIGSGFVLGGQVYRGAHGFAGESGHIVIDRHGPPHVTGVRGPWEMSASGSGLGTLAQAWGRDGRLSSLIEPARSSAGEQMIPNTVLDAAIATANPQALALLDEFACHVALGLTNLIYVLDPACIVVGGGLVDLGEPLRLRVQEQVDASTLGRDFRPDVPVVLAELGERSGALGAAMLAKQLLG